MKLARLGDLRRALESRDRATVPCITSLSISQLPGFGDVQIEPNASFIAICGGTGVGKTALLEMIYTALAPLPERDPLRPAVRLGSARAEVAVTYPGGIYERHVDLGNLEATWEGFAPEVQIVGLGDRASDLQILFCTQDVEVSKEGAASSDFSKDTRELVSMICRKDFTRVTVYEIEADDDLIAPFFEVQTPTSEYDSRTMASGELSVLYIAWAINRVAQLSIILIEEPEAYLPPASHAGIFGLICAAAVKRRLGLVITTHSSEIASQVPQSSLLSIRTQAGQSLVPVSAESKQRVLSRLGLAPQKSAILFVEDKIAEIVLSEALAMFEFAISTSIEIVVSNGAGGVRAALNSLPTGIGSFAFLGVLDGDMAADANAWGMHDRLVFLPFNAAMEAEFLAAIETKSSPFGVAINRSGAQIEEELHRTIGLEVHDRFQQIADRLGVPQDAFTRASFSLWLKVSGKRQAAKRFAHSLATSLKVTLP